MKYADATRAMVGLTQVDGYLHIEVQDDGRGFDPEDQAHGRGLSNMVDRLDSLSGYLEIRSAPDRGSTIVGVIPVEERRSD